MEDGGKRAFKIAALRGEQGPAGLQDPVAPTSESASAPGRQPSSTSWPAQARRRADRHDASRVICVTIIMVTQITLPLETQTLATSLIQSKAERTFRTGLCRPVLTSKDKTTRDKRVPKATQHAQGWDIFLKNDCPPGTVVQYLRVVSHVLIRKGGETPSEAVSLFTGMPGATVLEGSLHKRGKLHRTFKLRFFRLDLHRNVGTLSYYSKARPKRPPPTRARRGT